jgi:hypothetical protein
LNSPTGKKEEEEEEEEEKACIESPLSTPNTKGVCNRKARLVGR